MKRIFAAILIVVGILLITGAFAWSYLRTQFNTSPALSLPDSMAGLKITTRVTGKEAIAEFADLHGQEFPITSGVVGHYGDDAVTLWVASAESAPVARQMADAMQEKIAEGNSPFRPGKELKDGNRTIYTLEGMGQSHYYFQSKNLVIWLAVDPALADQVLQQTLEVYP